MLLGEDDLNDNELENIYLKFDESYKYTVQHCIDTEGFYFLCRSELENAKRKFIKGWNENNKNLS